MLALFMNKLNIVRFPDYKSMVYRVPNFKIIVRISKSE